MAYGNEVWIGVVGGEEIKRVLGTLDIKVNIPETADEYAEWNEKIDDALDTLALQTDLLDAHIECLNAAGFQLLAERPSAEALETDNIRISTPKGDRECCPFSFSLSFDFNEMDESPEEAILGVALSGRYRPTFLDWKNEHGTLYPVIFNNTTNRLISIAKKRILKIIPALSPGNIVVKEMHY